MLKAALSDSRMHSTSNSWLPSPNGGPADGNDIFSANTIQSAGSHTYQATDSTFSVNTTAPGTVYLFWFQAFIQYLIKIRTVLINHVVPKSGAWNILFTLLFFILHLLFINFNLYID